MGLADCFLQLHAQGLCYRDISLGNVFFDPETGQPLDLRQRQRRHRRREPAAGARDARFMAPEIVRGEAQPSTATDLYSLAVLIFYLLMFHHPLQGRRELGFPCFDRDAETRALRHRPAVRLRPRRRLQRPDPVDPRRGPGVLAAVPAVPARRLHPGVHRRPARTRRGACARASGAPTSSRLLDGIVVCACGRENLTDDGVPLGPCWSCQRDLPPPVRLGSVRACSCSTPAPSVTRHHLRRDYDYDEVVGEVVAHPPGRTCGACATRHRAWRATGPDGDEQEVAARPQPRPGARHLDRLRVGIDRDAEG